MVEPARIGSQEVGDSKPSKTLEPDSGLGDLRFRALVPTEDWRQLPETVQRRFSKRLSCGQVALYAGRIIETRFSRMGWILAQVLRFLGGPLPLSRDVDTTAVVSVGEDPQGGQLWTRLYHRNAGFPQMINSAKRFAGETGLEEHVGHGIGMALNVQAIDGGLIFTSDHYFCQIAGFRMTLPRWITPGQTKVSHIDRENGKFDFILQIEHRVFGELLFQRAEFEDQ